MKPFGRSLATAGFWAAQTQATRQDSRERQGCSDRWVSCGEVGGLQSLSGNQLECSRVRQIERTQAVCEEGRRTQRHRPKLLGRISMQSWVPALSKMVIVRSR